MAITATLVTNHPTVKKWDIIATADGDTALDVPHLMQDLPGYVASELIFFLAPVLATARISDWISEPSLNPNNITIRKTTTAGSGSGAVQARLIYMLPHSIL